MEKRLTLRKSCKLRHKSLVDAVFREGKSLYDYPLRLSWRVLDQAGLDENFRLSPPSPIGRAQMLITVPKKKRRHAVDRVLMRRRIREAYRLNRAPLEEALDARPDIRTVSIAFVYLHSENEPYAVIESKMQSLLGRLARKLAKGGTTNNK